MGNHPLARRHPARASAKLVIPRLYAHRFTDEARERKDRVWRVLCRSFLQRYVGADDTVLDLGAGYCEFINHIECGRKIAVDLSDDVRRYAGPGVEVLQSASTHLSALGDNIVNVAFASNFFEHLPLKKDLLTTLCEIRRVLKQGGRLLILQPNIRYVGGAYWDFFDHHLPLKKDLLTTLCEIRRVLKQGGRLLILQPNIRYVGGAYWDFFDHHLPL